MSDILASYNYEQKEIEKGYNKRTLYIDLSTNTIEEKPVSLEMIEKFVGGKGFDLWLLWNSLPKDKITKWDDPENEICIASGPLAGTTQYPGSGKSIVVTICPATGSIIDSNVGGYFGPYLKFAGFDALEIQGKAADDVTIVIDADSRQVRIEKAEGLPDDTHLLGAALGEKYGEGKPASIASVSAGSGADHTYFGCLNFSYYDKKRKSYHFKQAGRGGTGTVFRDKNIKALVAKLSTLKYDVNHPDDFDKLKASGKAYSKEIRELDPQQNEMAIVGTAHLVPIMNDHDLLPVNNFKYGSHPDAAKIGREAYRQRFDPGFDGCWMGCSVACAHMVKDYVPKTGPYRGEPVWVDGPEYETIAGCGSSWGCFRPRLHSRSEFLLRHLRGGHHFGRNCDCVRYGMLRDGAPQQRTHRWSGAQFRQPGRGARAFTPDGQGRGPWGYRG